MQKIDQEVVQNDQYVVMPFLLTDANGAPIDISGATLLLKVQEPGATTLKFSGAMTVLNGPLGSCQYIIQPGNFDTVGKFYAEIQITFLSNQIMTISGITISVVPELPR